MEEKKINLEDLEKVNGGTIDGDGYGSEGIIVRCNSCGAVMTQADGSGHHYYCPVCSKHENIEPVKL